LEIHSLTQPKKHDALGFYIVPRCLQVFEWLDRLLSLSLSIFFLFFFRVLTARHIYLYHFLICYQLKGNHKVEHEEIKKIVTSSNISAPACVATAMTTMVVGYVLAVDIQLWFSTSLLSTLIVPLFEFM